MRQIRRTVLGGALGVMLGAIASPGLQAQVPVPDLRAQVPRASTGIPWPTAIESQFARMRVDGVGRERTADGFSVRLVYGARGADDADEERSWLARRTELAVFLARAREPRREGDGRWTTAGIAADLRPLERPIGGRLEPFASLGVGLLRETEAAWVMPTSLRFPPAREARTRSGAALLPGAGLRLRLTPRLALQAEARDLVALREEVRHNLLFGTGLRVDLF